ncbi:MAG: hypothetical protein AB1806_16815 [Acidobacteriota bacterium]
MRFPLVALLILLSVAAMAQAPAFEVTPGRLSFIVSAGGNLPSQIIAIKPTGSEAVRWQITASARWLQVSATSGTGATEVRVGVDGRGLSPGQYNGRITVTGPPGTGPVVVAVMLQILSRPSGAAQSSGAVAALTLSSPAGSREPASAVISLQDEPTAPAAWRVEADQPWISVDPASGAVPARVTVTAAAEGLGPGEHLATLVFTDRDGRPWMKVPVAFLVEGAESLQIAADVLPPATRNLPYTQALPIRGGKPPYLVRIVEGRLPPGLALSGSVISGVARSVGTYPLVLSVTDASTPPTTTTQPVLFQVIVLFQDTALVVSPPSVQLQTSAMRPSQGARLAIGSGRQPLAWRATADASWLRLSPERGISPSVLQVDVNGAALEPGTYAGTITITMEGAPNSPARVAVQVEVRK